MSHDPTPADRLALSRERLRLAMRDAPPHARATEGRATGGGADWLAALKSSPGGSVVIEAVGRWWAQHPLRLFGMVAADAANALVKTAAQRQPLGLVLAALVLGGAFAWSRPWRWILTPALFAGLLPLGPVHGDIGALDQ